MVTSTILQFSEAWPIIATAFFDDNIGKGKPPYDGSSFYCGPRSYTITTSAGTANSPLNAITEIKIDQITGVVTANTLNLATVGTHTITITAALTRSGLTTVTSTISFSLEVRCVL